VNSRAIPLEDADNPYALPRADVGAPSMTSESETETLRLKLAHLESFAKAVGVVCIIVAIYDVVVVVYYAVWAILAELDAISTRWPFHRSAANIGIALGVLVAITGLTAGYGLRHLRLWSLWTLGAFSLALWSQFAVVTYHDYQRGQPIVALMTLALGAMLLTPVIALCRLDLSPILSIEYGRMVAETPRLRIAAKLPLVVKCIMALLLLILTGLAWSL
jgi:hypothetical protein